jgi:type I restriction-modification system DNA methylase subunit
MAKLNTSSTGTASVCSGEYSMGQDGCFGLQGVHFGDAVRENLISELNLKKLIKHFNKYRLWNEGFVFPDLLGMAYEYLIAEFADLAGKKGGEFYTLREAV